MAVKGFTFYMTYWDVANELDDDNRGLFYCAVADYMFADIDREDELPFQAKVAFKCIKANLKTSKNRGEVGQMGRGKSKTKANESKTEANQKQTKARLISSSSSSSSSSSRPKCPKCGKPASRNQQMGRWECHGCWEVIG